jgi:hypothetical protein
MVQGVWTIKNGPSEADFMKVLRRKRASLEEVGETSPVMGGSRRWMTHGFYHEMSKTRGGRSMSYISMFPESIKQTYCGIGDVALDWRIWEETIHALFAK